MLDALAMAFRVVVYGMGIVLLQISGLTVGPS